MVQPRGGSTPRFQTVAEAAQSQSEDAVLEMMSEGADVDAADMDGNTAVHWAVWFRLDSLLTKLLERGAHADRKNVNGEAPVHWAAKASNFQAIQALVKGDHGMLSQRDCEGFTPFIFLSQNDNAPIMEWVYLRGISVEEQDNFGRTALHWACYRGHRRTVQWLLSRSADISHRDHEGMTAMHWAALKGHDAVADMLINVGAVNLLHLPDGQGDTPMDLARRKKNRYLVINLYKCQIFNFIFGRPHLVRNHFAGLFALFSAFNFIVFATVIAPGIARQNLGTVLSWCCLMGLTICFWVMAYRANPGWITGATICRQRCTGEFEEFDADQPVESQLAQAADRGSDHDDLMRLELEQTKHNYQRHLLTAARRNLGDTGLCTPGGPCTGGSRGSARGGPWEMQPLMENSRGSDMLPLVSQQKQLDCASFELKRRCLATSDCLGKQRVASLLSRGRDDYLELLDKGSFKQVCVVCRVKREMRSHHCKECGRCVRRLDHHCPWIDNCVGLGNQRLFYFFIVTLLTTIVGFYWSALLFVLDAIVPAWTSGAALRTLLHVSDWSVGPELRPLLLLLACAFNAVWLAFVGALVLRHTAYMLVNVTTFEVLTRPAHVQRRFPKTSGRFWYLQDFDPLQAVKRFMDYWTLNMDKDSVDFKVVEPASHTGNSWRRHGIQEPPEAQATLEDGTLPTVHEPCEAERLEGLIACEQRRSPMAAEQDTCAVPKENTGIIHNALFGENGNVPPPERTSSGLWPRDS